jgi:hypothetical protein
MISGCNRMRRQPDLKTLAPWINRKISVPYLSFAKCVALSSWKLSRSCKIVFRNGSTYATSRVWRRGFMCHEIGVSSSEPNISKDRPGLWIHGLDCRSRTTRVRLAAWLYRVLRDSGSRTARRMQCQQMSSSERRLRVGRPTIRAMLFTCPIRANTASAIETFTSGLTMPLPQGSVPHGK